MATWGSSSATATGLAITTIAVGAGVSSAAGFTLLLSFAGVLAGAILIFAGVRMGADNPGLQLAAGVRVRVGALVHCLRRNLALTGLLLASAAASAAAADGEAGPVLCFSAFTLLLLGLSLLNVGVLLLEEQEH